jgi:signal transduction histidine kinase
LTISRIEMGRLAFNPAQVNIRQFARDIVDSLQKSTATHHFVFSPQGEGCMAVVDTQLLRHILMNLLTNAVKYSAEGSAVYLDLSCQPEKIVIQVRDEGIGIPPEDRPHLFEPFHRASNVGNVSGTGLGLTIVKQMVERHGGSITFDTTLGVGTTFTVVIPTNPPLGEQESESG